MKPSQNTAMTSTSNRNAEKNTTYVHICRYVHISTYRRTALPRQINICPDIHIHTHQVPSLQNQWAFPTLIIKQPTNPGYRTFLSDDIFPILFLPLCRFYSSSMLFHVYIFLLVSIMCQAQDWFSKSRKEDKRCREKEAEKSIEKAHEPPALPRCNHS